MGVHAPWISHLMFADDCFSFTQASTRGADQLVDILNRYQRGSGQMVNIGKLAIFFSVNCSDQDKLSVMTTSGVTTIALGENYLGLPRTVGRCTKEAFEHNQGRFCGYWVVGEKGS